jgi:hypothetical protein
VPRGEEINMRARHTLAVVAVVAVVTAGPGAAAEQPHAASASIGEVDCSALTVPVALNNTASLTATTFLVDKFEFSGTGKFYETFQVPAGARQDVRVPVRDHRAARIFVYDETLQVADHDEAQLAHEDIEVACTPKPEFAPDATLGPVNCADHTRPLTLDNTRSEVAVEFWVYGGGMGAGPLRFDEKISVAPGDETTVHVPVGNDLFEFNTQVSDPPDETDPWIFNDYVFTVDCPTDHLARTGFNPMIMLIGLALVSAGALSLLWGRRAR